MSGKEEGMRAWRYGAILPAVGLLALLLTACGGDSSENVTAYQEKAALLRERAVTEAIQWELGDTPAGDVGHVVFISLCDTQCRASVHTGAGPDLAAAWKAADSKAASAVRGENVRPVWVKADIVYISEQIPMDELERAVYGSRDGFFRYGAAFDNSYETALLEAELNGAQIYEYGEGGVDLSALNAYLEGAGRGRLDALPESVTVFQTFGWLCDGDNTVHPLNSSGLDYGRRTIETIDAAYAEELIYSACDFLANQIQEDGRFIYGYDPRFDAELEGYNIVRHASAIWALLCRCRMEPNGELAGLIGRAIDYMLHQVVYENGETAYLYEEKDDDIQLGGCGMAVIALAEYMDVFQNERYLEVCRHLGNGILALMDQEAGTYVHVLNGDFSLKEGFRTVYYDGEATFALCRLYALTGERRWLDAARSAVDHFIEGDYTQYRDHWVSYSMNEITRYITDHAGYYSFALQNIHANLEEIRRQDATNHTDLELLMAVFEAYGRMLDNGVMVTGFDEAAFLKAIYARADRMLDGFFYPEYAMYMENPQRILGSFMVRHDGCRVRVDDVGHNIGGYYLYWKNYDKLVAYGLPEHRD